MSKQTYGNGDDAILLPTTTNSGTTAIVSPAQDMRRFDTIGLLLVTTGTIAGSWKIEASNDFVTNSTGAVYGQAQNASPQWGTVTSIFTPTIAAVTSGGSSQATGATSFPWRQYRVTFTPTSGSGTVTVKQFLKSI
jgi:hypothetical protein